MEFKISRIEYRGFKSLCFRATLVQIKEDGSDGAAFEGGWRSSLEGAIEEAAEKADPDPFIEQE